MSTLTIQIEDDRLIEKASRIARQKKTSVDAMISGFLSSLPESEQEQARRDSLAAEFNETVREFGREWGGRGYADREELYER